MENNFQRVGAISNAHVGREFEEAARLFLAETGITLQLGFRAPVGHKIKKSHKFDLGGEKPPILVECKSYTWTSGGNPHRRRAVWVAAPRSRSGRLMRGRAWS